MSVKLDLNSVSNKDYQDDYAVQYIPCSIEHNGKAAIDQYFSKYVREETTKSEDSEKVLHGIFRGYPLTGQVLPAPEGYTGVVLKETKRGLNLDEPRTLKAVCQFKKFTFWNWDRKPSRADKYQQAMDWAAISDVIHDDK